MERTVPAQAGGRTGPGVPVIYETPNFRVVVGRLTGGSADTYDEMRVRYIVQHKKHGVIYGTSGSIASAQMAALQAEREVYEAGRICVEEEARNFRPENGATTPPNFGGIN